MNINERAEFNILSLVYRYVIAYFIIGAIHAAISMDMGFDIELKFYHNTSVKEITKMLYFIALVFIPLEYLLEVKLKQSDFDKKMTEEK